MEKLKSTISAKYKSFLKEMLSFTEKKENLNAVLNSVLEAFPTIAEFFSATTQTLKQTTLLSNASLELLSLNRAISKKLDTPIPSRQKLNTTLLARSFCQHIVENHNIEQFYCLYLDNNCKLISYSRLAYGLSSNANLRMKQITENAFKSNSKNIIICHNHPNGTILPSQEDYLFTERLCLNLMLNDITLLDHIIITQNGSSSMLELGTLPELKLKVFNNAPLPNKKTKQYLYTTDKYTIEY